MMAARRPWTCAPRWRPAGATRAAHDAVRRVVPFLEVDREFRPDIDACLGANRDGSVVAAVESAIGPLD